MGKLTPPEPEVESSPVSAKGSNLFRFWIAELAVYTQLVLIFKNAKYSKKDASSSTHERSRERGGGLITGEPSGGHMTCFRVGKREADGGNKDGEGGNLHIQLRRLVFVCSS